MPKIFQKDPESQGPQMNVHSTRKLKLTFSSSSTFVPPNSGKRTWSPIFTDNGTVSPFSFRFPGPQATTLPSRTLPIDFSGSIIPPLVLVSAATRSISTRSNRGLKRFKVAWKILSSTQFGHSNNWKSEPFIVQKSLNSGAICCWCILNASYFRSLILDWVISNSQFNKLWSTLTVNA